MAVNEYFRRTPTCTGNRYSWTLSFWVKRNAVESGNNSGNSSGGFMNFYTTQTSTPYQSVANFNADGTIQLGRNQSAADHELNTVNVFRDVGSWMHILVKWDVSSGVSQERLKLYVNGVLQDDVSGSFPSQNYEGSVNSMVMHTIGTVIVSGVPYAPSGPAQEYFDWFLVDGQALEPDVFGFYKDGKGYQSSGNKFETDFRPGQWSPHLPRKIKSDIERRGGFGVNGFYLPMNSSNNFGADFHMTPNTILKLKENLPQPKSEIDGGGNYTGALRDDPLKQYLVLAIPGVINGLGSGYGDYSASIRGSGTNKTVTAHGNAGVTACASHYGSALNFDGTTDYLQIPHSEDFNMGTGDFTLECWVHSIDDSDYQGIFGSYNYDNAAVLFQIANNGALRFVNPSALDRYGTSDLQKGQWNHIVMERYNGRLYGYVNGVVEINVSYTSSIDWGHSGNDVTIGVVDRTDYPGQYEYKGQIQDIRLYKGIAKYKGGFDVPKPYMPLGIETWRAVPDNCKNNFCTLNPLDTNQLAANNGNVSIDQSSGGWHSLLGTHYVRSGKWYAEMRIDRLGWIFFGVEQTWLESRTRHIGGQTGSKGAGLVYNTGNRGDITYNGTNNAYTGGDATAATGDIISIALDLDTNSVKFYKNNVLQYDLANVLESGADYAFGVSPYSDVAATVNFGQNPTFSGQITAGTHTDSNGKGLFKYQPPAGYLALCDDNLPTPAVADPGEHFKCVLYEGTGDLHTISNVGFKPDLVWLKCRSHGKWHALVDSIRGNHKTLHSNSTSVETNETHVIGFNENGFTVDDIDSGTANENGMDYVAWCWKAGGPAVTNNDGQITTQVSVNQTAGFSIVTWLSNAVGSIQTLGHGLGKSPDFIIVKNRDYGYDWFVWHKDLANTTRGYLKLNTPDAETTGGSDTWSISSTTFGLRQSSMANANTDDFVAYCWTEIEGYSKFGKYLGNGNADGPFIYCGFKPAWLMIKPYGNPSDSCYSGGYSSWSIYDSSRSPVNDTTMHERVLFANRAYEEGKRGNGASSGVFQNIDLLSNGFKLRGNSNCEVNTTSSNGFIFVAFAESPFQTANAK